MSMAPRVLVADDDAGVRGVLRAMLRRGDYEVVEVEDGRAALDAFERDGADLILSDLQMPRMSGLELLRRIRALDDTTGFIILTGAGTVENAVEALRLQADDYLVKPFNVDEVLFAAERALSYRRLLRENRAHQQHLRERVAEQAAQLKVLLLDALRSLAAAIETRDDYTGGHVERVARYAAATGREMGLSGEDLRALWVGALLHDVGKIGVSDAVLRKAGPLTDEEYAEMKRHPEIGAAIMARSSFLVPGLPAVLHHQEHWDGTGYPAGLRGEEISLQGRIISVVDTYDAIITRRPYRDARTSEEALAELSRCAGTQFDPGVVEAFVRAARNGFPVDPDTPAGSLD
ncbi:response regulator RpfG family c-di-GMP phosphodiesterase [Longimicrobium terrae]|uniref:Response regulator RpfG family c-di-GMP phosphodiesterase n=2 Tax=Longimicrobium terrae TaxID=1639882 RepID=A0A841GW39_9BACT|nr:response regulator RpfG family c-di-GMP phosphodiesterase [Longimicrobium terrae]MBB6069225.1 response regulator RpfG family c-di-GMP phosphodiesterase [Longimicrobium terrae]NNC31963.1 response regulator [Longimicrobium terrae]